MGVGQTMSGKILIPLVDLRSEYRRHQKEIDQSIKKVLGSGVFILGENVRLFEKKFASYLGAKYAVGVASGTDALILSLRALGIKEGQEVIIPANSYPTAFAVAATRAKLKLVDIDPKTLNIDPFKIEKAVIPSTFAIIPVHLYGLVAEMEPILKIAKKHNLFVVEDCAQAHGAVHRGKKVGTLGDTGCFSFYPTKNLGCFGDGGMIVTNSKKIAEVVKELRMYGEKERYQSLRLGVNSRLDEIQAGILREKLKKLERFNQARRKIASWYSYYLSGAEVVLPEVIDSTRHVYHQFVVRTQKRDLLKSFLAKKGVETAIHYPIPVHLVESFKFLGYKKGDFPESERMAEEMLSLPCHPYLTQNEVRRICNFIKDSLR